jgi:CheY-like chemotaxis protein
MPDGQDKPKVLIADDEVAIAETIALILRAHGFDAKTVSSGEAAVETALEFRPDFLLSDLRMGAMDGVEAGIRVRQLCPKCKVVVFSATILDGDARARLRGLGFDFLSKPIHPSQLLAHLRN